MQPRARGPTGNHDRRKVKEMLSGRLETYHGAKRLNRGHAELSGPIPLRSMDVQIGLTECQAQGGDLLILLSEARRQRSPRR